MITDVSDIIFIDPRTQRDQWLTYRMSGIGGSDVAGICGISNWSTPLSVYMDKIGEKAQEEESEFITWGRILEDPISREYEHRTGKIFQPIHGILQHREYPWAIASLDGEFKGKDKSGVLEIKTTNFFKSYEWKDNKIPDYYMTQVQWYLFLTGYKVADIACLIGGNRMIIREGIERNENMIRHLVQICERFWTEYVLPRNPPPVDGSEVSSQLLKTMYPKSSGSVVELGTSGGDILAKLHSVKTAINTLKDEKRLYENRLKEMLKTAETGTVDGKAVVNWKTSEYRRVDSNKLKSNYPEAYKNCLKTSKQRKFLLKGDN